MGDDDTTHAVTVVEAARLSVLFAASVGVVTFAAILAITVGDHGGSGMPALHLLNVFLSWPLWAVLISGVALFALTARRYLFTRWDFAWRGALSCYIGIATATCGTLVIGIAGSNLGYGGGFIWVVVSLIGFTIIGGPVLAGLLAALLRPRRLREDRTAVERTDARRRLGHVVLFAGAALCLGLVGSSALVSAHGGLEYKCLVEGPRPTEPPLAVVSEASGIVEGSFTLWPVGRQCEWDRADGLGTVTANSGAWGTTAFAGGGALLAIAGAGMVLLSREYSH
jgi:hypothetical protein